MDDNNGQQPDLLAAALRHPDVLSAFRTNGHPRPDRVSPLLSLSLRRSLEAAIAKEMKIDFEPLLVATDFICFWVFLRITDCAMERLTFEEFFNHPFLSQRQSNELLRNRKSPKTIVGFPFSKCSPVRNAEEGSQEDNLPFSLDDVSNGPDRSPSFVRKPSMKSTVRFSSGGFV